MRLPEAREVRVLVLDSEGKRAANSYVRVGYFLGTSYMEWWKKADEHGVAVLAVPVGSVFELTGKTGSQESDPERYTCARDGTISSAE